MPNRDHERTLKELAKSYKNTGDFNRSIENLYKLQTKFEKEEKENKFKYSKIFAEKALAFKLKGQLNEAIENYEFVIDLCKKKYALKANNLETEAYINLAELNSSLGKIENATSALTSSENKLDYYRRSNNLNTYMYYKALLAKTRGMVCYRKAKYNELDKDMEGAKTNYNKCTGFLNDSLDIFENLYKNNCARKNKNILLEKINIYNVKSEIYIKLGEADFSKFYLFCTRDLLEEFSKNYRLKHKDYWLQAHNYNIQAMINLDLCKNLYLKKSINPQDTEELINLSQYNALNFAEIALNLQKKYSDKYNPDIAKTLENLSEIHKFLGNNLKSSILLYKAFLILKHNDSSIADIFNISSKLKVKAPELLEKAPKIEFINSYKQLDSDLIEINNKIRDTVLKPVMESVESGNYQDLIDHRVIEKYIDDNNEEYCYFKYISGYLSPTYLGDKLEELCCPETFKFAKLLIFEAVCLKLSAEANNNNKALEFIAEKDPNLVDEVISMAPQYLVDAKFLEIIENANPAANFSGLRENIYYGREDLDQEDINSSGPAESFGGYVTPQLGFGQGSDYAPGYESDDNMDQGAIDNNHFGSDDENESMGGFSNVFEEGEF
jgi:tetratricopeptide (TPR) repeat protein